MLGPAMLGVCQVWHSFKQINKGNLCLTWHFRQSPFPPTPLEGALIGDVVVEDKSVAAEYDEVRKLNDDDDDDGDDDDDD